VLGERFNITHTTIQLESEQEVSFRRTAKS
jgi:hypothetical protein